jgi:lysophospholipase L1-like esterase
MVSFRSIGLLALAAAGLVEAQAKVKIMALGDSITGSPVRLLTCPQTIQPTPAALGAVKHEKFANKSEQGCWRALLWRKLQDAGIQNTDFVGTLPGQGCGFDYDGENEGHGGYLATNIATQNQLVGWLSQTTPDVVMMHLGTNDVWSNLSPSTILGAFNTLIKQMRASKPTMKILVGFMTCPRLLGGRYLHASLG